MKEYYIMLRHPEREGYFRTFPLLMSKNEEEITKAFWAIREVFIRFGYEVGARTIGTKTGLQIYIEVVGYDAN